MSEIATLAGGCFWCLNILGKAYAFFSSRFS